ncbi:MAG TPA: ATP-binding cassette domain-containing protein [Acidimicrobiia bacterium]|nr:ATP-binding cassette domain-containing protein [Acidimicrobiia bacterium]
MRAATPAVRLLVGVVGVLGTWAVLARVLSRGLPPGVILLGVVLGSLTALTAMGLVLVYRAARVINFAQVAIGSAAATLTLELANIRHWSYWASVGAGLVFAAVLGAAVDLLVIRRFFTVPRLILTLATVGLAQVFAGIELALPALFDDSRSVLGGSMEVPIDFTREVQPIFFSGGHFMIMLAVPVVMAGLVYLLKGTAAGRGIRGASENIERARLSGVPVRHLSTGVWVLAALLSTLSAILTLPISGTVRGAAGEPTLLLPALAAAVLARMTSLPQAALAAIGLGVLQQSVFWTTGRAGLIDLAYLMVILVALPLQRDRSTRAESGALSSWVRVGDVPPIPAALRRLPEVVWARRLLYAGVLGVVLVLRAVMSVQQLSLLGTITVVYALVALSLVVLTGWTGQISLGQFAIVGVGAVAAGNLLAEARADLFLALLGAGAAGLVTSVALGLPALRVRGLFLPVTTLALAVSMSSYFLNPTYVKSGIPATVGRPVLLGQFDLADEGNLFLFCAAVLAVAVVVVVNLRRRRPGRAWLAVRDNEWAAEARGLSLARTRLAAFAVSGALAGVAGGLHVVALNGVNVGTYAPSLSFEAFSMVVVGGLTSVWGAIIGAVALRYAEYVVSGGLQLIVTGAGVLFLLLVFPGGLGEVGLRIRRFGLDLIARRRGLDEGRPPAEDVSFDRVLSSDEATDAPDVVVARAVYESAGEEVHSDLDDRAAFLSARGLDVAYGSLQVLFGVDFDVRPGEVVALLGTNGAGKSTLVRALSGLTPPRRGTVTFDGHDITGASPEHLARLGIAHAPGGRGVYPGLTVGENLRLAMWTFRSDKERYEEATERVFELFPILRERAGQSAGLLSGGQQQMLALAQALAPDPRLLIIDELSLGLAPTVVEELLDVVAHLKGGGLTTILVEQSVTVALHVASRAVFLEKGTVRFSGAAADLAERDDLLRSVFLEGGGRQVRPAPVGHFANNSGSDGQDRPSEVLACHDLSVRFGGLTAVDGAGLTVRQGEIVGLIGPNGAGKTTLVDALSGFVRPDVGRVRFAGADVTGLGPRLRALSGLARSFQDSRLFPGLTVGESLAVASERTAAPPGPLSAGLRLPGSGQFEATVGERVETLLADLGLEAWRDRFPSQLSTGVRRLVELGSLLAQEPRVLLLDEPSAGLAEPETQALGGLLRRVRDRTGCAIVIVAHDVPLLLAIADRLVAMDLGRIIADGTPAEVVRHPAVVSSYLGSAATRAMISP